MLCLWGSGLQVASISWKVTTRSRRRLAAAQLTSQVKRPVAVPVPFWASKRMPALARSKPSEPLAELPVAVSVSPSRSASTPLKVAVYTRPSGSFISGGSGPVGTGRVEASTGGRLR